MAQGSKNINRFFKDLFTKKTQKEIVNDLKSDYSEYKSINQGYSYEAMISRIDNLELPPNKKKNILDKVSIENRETYSSNIENYIGTVKVPIGIAGPLRVKGLFANGDYTIPLATTEAALVASYNRGANVITKSGGCRSLLVSEGVSRAPGFVFGNIVDAGQFSVWINSKIELFQDIVKENSRYCKLHEMKINLEGNHIYVIFEYFTGDASGQNMVTIATERICKYILENSPIEIEQYFVEANMSGDKKASFQSFLSVRGKKVSSEIIIPSELITTMLSTTAEKMFEYWKISSVGSSLIGTIGMQGHYSNGIAALYLATGQDVACVSESSIGLTRLDLISNGDLYIAVTLPNLMVGTVGGGTGLPSQNACLNILGMAGENKARAFAEISASLCLAGEISIIAALSSGNFTKAHELLARLRKRK